MGAAGRDFHNFNTAFRNDETCEVVAFTATQIPNIDGRRYPAALAGPLYPEGIPIEDEADLTRLVRERDVDAVVFAYSDVPHQYVMARASVAGAAGADFWLLGPKATMLRSSKPVIAVTAVRTGAGKSQTTRHVAEILKGWGQRVAVVRHPMPYGDLAKQAVQRFASLADLDAHDCTIEEREEYEPHISRGNVVYAGVDYEKILRQAESEADVVLWDGGNNDFAFFKPDLTLVVADPHRVGHELTYYPGALNLRLADVVILNKVDTAEPEDVEALRANVRAANPEARVVEAHSPIRVEDPEVLRNRRVLVIEDGPTLTHGEMRYGAGTLGARDTRSGPSPRRSRNIPASGRCCRRWATASSRSGTWRRPSRPRPATRSRSARRSTCAACCGSRCPRRACATTCGRSARPPWKTCWRPGRGVPKAHPARR